MNKRYDELVSAIIGMKCLINNPSAWDHFSQNVSDNIEEAVRLAEEIKDCDEK